MTVPSKIRSKVEHFTFLKWFCDYLQLKETLVGHVRILSMLSQCVKSACLLDKSFR
jgi:hypothetical protein